MKYILNPGDFYDVSTYETRREALAALEKTGSKFAALYSYGAGTFRRYERGNWFTIEKSNLQIKVIEAAQKARAS